MTEETALPPRKTSRFRTLAAFIASDALGTGGKASLRRGVPATVVGQPAFHQAIHIASIVVNELDAEVWGAIVQAIALTAGNDFTIPAGRAMAAAGLSEARFSKLMAARGDTLRDQIGLIARYLAAKQTPIDWTDLGNLLLADCHGDEETVAKLRFRLAQGYYRELNSADQRKAG